MKAPPPKKGVPHFELEDALTRDGCAVCRLVEEAGRSYVEALLYESVNDPGTQRSFRSSLGFCGRHARPMLSMNEGLGVAILYGVAAKEALGLLSGIPDAPARPGATLRTKLAALLGRGSRRGPAMPEPGDGCAACRVEEKAEGRCLHALVEGAAEGYLDGSLGGNLAMMSGTHRPTSVVGRTGCDAGRRCSHGPHYFARIRHRGKLSVQAR